VQQPPAATSRLQFCNHAAAWQPHCLSTHYATYGSCLCASLSKHLFTSACVLLGLSCPTILYLGFISHTTNKHSFLNITSLLLYRGGVQLNVSHLMYATHKRLRA